MKTDAEIREDVIRELRWDFQITDPDAIGVAVKDGAVTLTGHTPTYAEKLAAVRAAERVYGVKAVANDLKVNFPGIRGTTPRSPPRSPTSWTTTSRSPPAGSTPGCRTAGSPSTGDVKYDFQRREVERMVRNVRGVIGVTDLITVTPPASPERIREAIEDTFRREAEVDARHVSVDVTDHTARLYGHVHSVKEANAARAAAAAAPGIADVESHLVISP